MWWKSGVQPTPGGTLNYLQHSLSMTWGYPEDCCQQECPTERNFIAWEDKLADTCNYDITKPFYMYFTCTCISILFSYFSTVFIYIYCTWKIKFFVGAFIKPLICLIINNRKFLTDMYLHFQIDTNKTYRIAGLWWDGGHWLGSRSYHPRWSLSCFIYNESSIRYHCQNGFWQFLGHLTVKAKEKIVH